MSSLRTVGHWFAVAVKHSRRHELGVGGAGRIRKQSPVRGCERERALGYVFGRGHHESLVPADPARCLGLLPARRLPLHSLGNAQLVTLPKVFQQLPPGTVLTSAMIAFVSM